LQVEAVQSVPKPLARHIAPQLAHVLGLGREQGFHRGDARAEQFLLHAGTDTGNILEFEPQKRRRHILWMPHHIAVGLARLAGHLRQLPIGGKANRAKDMRADVFREARLDPPAQCLRRVPVGGGDTAGQLVNGLDRIDRNDGGNLRNQRIVGAAIEIGRLRHEENVRASRTRLGDGHDVFDAAQLGLAGAGDNAGVLGFRERHNPDRAPPQMRARLLFDGGEEAVEIEVQPFDVCRPAHAKGSREGKRD